MTVIARMTADPFQFVRFTWSDDLTECSFVAFGEGANAALPDLLAADVHEGADLDGWTVEVS